jgi:hypothetical protein
VSQTMTLPPEMSEQEVDRHEATLVWPPLILSILALWIVPLWTSLGLDESGNWWVLKDGWSEMLRRAAMWSGGQSVLFNAFVMAVRQVAGDSDIALRIPSVLMMLGTLVLLYRLGLRLGGPFVGMVSCLALVTQREIVYVASVLRPYALGVFLATAAMLALLNWLDTGRTSWALLYVLCAGLTPYANYVHGSMFLVHAICALGRIYRKQTSVRLWHVAVSWLSCLALMIPLIQQALSLYGRRKQEGYLGAPNLEELFVGMFPVFLVGSILVTICIYLIALWFLGRRHEGDFLLVRNWPNPVAQLAEPIVWAIVPPLLIVILGLFTDIHLYAGRYYLVNAPGVALLLGMAVRSLAAAPLRRYIPIVIAAGAIISLGFQERFMRGLFDYRGAFAAIQKEVKDADSPVIFVSGFVESGNFANVLDPLLSRALMAPALRYYPFGHLIVVPSLLSQEAENYLEQIFRTQIQQKKQFVVCGLFGAEFYRVWLSGRLWTSGFRIAHHDDYGGVDVIVFEKIAP